MDPSIRRLLTPGPAEIIRAFQKDTEYVRILQDDLSDVVQQIVGPRNWQKYREKIKYFSTLLYYSLTNMSGLQTLGEEYTGIVQFDESGQKIPGKLKLSLVILLTTFGQPSLEYVIKLLEKRYLANRTVSGVSNNSQLSVLLDSLRIIKDYLPFFGQIHLATFYLHGTFYHFSKRFLGIYYLLVKRSFANQDLASRRTLQYLTWLSVTNLMLIAIHDSFAFIKRKTKNNEQLEKHNTSAESVCDTLREDSTIIPMADVDSSKKCTLCLEQRKNSSVTPCGHLFCWNCIIDWLRTKQECPVCREQFIPSRVVPLQNYS